MASTELGPVRSTITGGGRTAARAVGTRTSTRCSIVHFLYFLFVVLFNAAHGRPDDVGALRMNLSDARGEAHANAALCLTPWLRAKGGGEEARRCGPGRRHPGQGVGRGCGAADGAPCGSIRCHGRQWWGAAAEVAGPSGLPRLADAPAHDAVADVAGFGRCPWEKEGGAITNISNTVVVDWHRGKEEDEPNIKDATVRMSNMRKGDRGKGESRGGDGHNCTCRCRRRYALVDATAAVAVARRREWAIRNEDAAPHRSDVRTAAEGGETRADGETSGADHGCGSGDVCRGGGMRCRCDEDARDEGGGGGDGWHGYGEWCAMQGDCGDGENECRCRDECADVDCSADDRHDGNNSGGSESNGGGRGNHEYGDDGDDKMGGVTYLVGGCDVGDDGVMNDQLGGDVGSSILVGRARSGHRERNATEGDTTRSEGARGARTTLQVVERDHLAKSLVAHFATPYDRLYSVLLHSPTSWSWGACLWPEARFFRTAPRHSPSPSRSAAARSARAACGGPTRIIGIIAAAVIHLALLPAAQACAAIIGALAWIACWGSGRGDRGTATLRAFDEAAVRRMAIRAGRKRVRQRKRPRVRPHDRVRARCRRAEAWVAIYLMISGHVIPRACSGGPRNETHWQRDNVEQETVNGQGEAAAAGCNTSGGSGGDARGAWRGMQRAGLQRLDDEVLGVAWWSHAVRVGEAGNPGPTAISLAVDGMLRKVYGTARAAMTYPSPGRRSLRGAVAPGYEAASSDQGGEDRFALSVEAANTTGWKGLQRRLVASGAHALLAQETWITQDAIPAASAWALRRGWKSVWTAAKPGPNGGGLRRHCYFCPRLPRPEVPP